MWGTAGETRTNSLATFSSGFQHVDVPVLANQQGFTYISSVWTQNAAKKICQRMVDDMDVKRGNSILSAYLKPYKCIQKDDYH